MGAKRVPLATLVMSLRKQAERPPEVALDNSPPRIFASARPASLVVFDGEPVLAPIAGTHAVIRGEYELGRVQRHGDEEVVPAE